MPLLGVGGGGGGGGESDMVLKKEKQLKKGYFFELGPKSHPWKRLANFCLYFSNLRRFCIEFQSFYHEFALSLP